MSLADELLADFEEAGEDVEDTEGDGQTMELADVDDVSLTSQAVSKNSVRNIAKLRDSAEVHFFVSCSSPDHCVLSVSFCEPWEQEWKRVNILSVTSRVRAPKSNMFSMNQ